METSHAVVRDDVIVCTFCILVSSTTSRTRHVSAETMLARLGKTIKTIMFRISHFPKMSRHGSMGTYFYGCLITYHRPFIRFGTLLANKVKSTPVRITSTSCSKINTRESSNLLGPPVVRRSEFRHGGVKCPS